MPRPHKKPLCCNIRVYCVLVTADGQSTRKSVTIGWCSDQAVHLYTAYIYEVRVSNLGQITVQQNL